MTDTRTKLRKALEKLNSATAIVTDAMLSESDNLQSQAQETPQEFSVGQEVVVWETGKRGHVALGNEKTPGVLVCGPDGYYRLHVADELLAIPTKPPNGKGYEVGEWKRPDENDEGWLSHGGKAIWVDEGGTPGQVVQKWSHGYRFPISREREAKFEKGKRVRILAPYSECDATDGVICEVTRNDQRGWRYKIPVGASISFWYSEADLELADEARVPEAKFEKGDVVRDVRGRVHRIDDRRRHLMCKEWEYRILNDASRGWIWYLESGLELSSATDEAPRQDLPSTPPPYEGKDGKVEMRWRRKDGEVVWQVPVAGDLHYDCKDGEVYRLDATYGELSDLYPICEPVPVVQGWPEGTKWLMVTVNRKTRTICAINPCDHQITPWTSGSVLFLTVPVDGFVIPTDIVIPERSSDE